MNDEKFMPTRAAVIHDIIRACNAWEQVPAHGMMGPRTFALLALDYLCHAGVSDKTLYAAGVPVTANEGVPEGALRLFRRGDAESLDFTHYRTDSWMSMYA